MTTDVRVERNQPVLLGRVFHGLLSSNLGETAATQFLRLAAALMRAF
jgi:hypothetical protein